MCSVTLLFRAATDWCQDVRTSAPCLMPDGGGGGGGGGGVGGGGGGGGGESGICHCLFRC